MAEEEKDIHAEMRNAVKGMIDEEGAVDQGNEEDVQDEGEFTDDEQSFTDEQDSAPEYTPEELEAMDLGWNPEGKDRDGNTLSAHEFLARKPLFNKIKNQANELDEIKKVVQELQEDNKKIARASIKEKQDLLDQLKQEREKALDNLDTDEVRDLDKRIDNVQDELSENKEPEEGDAKDYVSPHFEPFLEQNSWAKDQHSALYHAGIGLAQQYIAMHGPMKPGEDKPMYDYIHNQIRKEFPEKFDDTKDVKKQQSRVQGSKKRSTGGYGKKKQVTLADLPEDEREVVRVMMRATGKTEEEYLKNYSL